MKLKNISRQSFSINLKSLPPAVSLHLAPKETSKSLKKELVESSSEVRNLIKARKLVMIASEEKKVAEKVTPPADKAKQKKGGS